MLVRSAARGAAALAQQARGMAGLVPVVIESTSRGERAFDIYSRLLRVSAAGEGGSGVWWGVDEVRGGGRGGVGV